MREIASKIIEGFKQDMQFHRFFERLISEIHERGGGVSISHREYFEVFGYDSGDIEEVLKDLSLKENDVFSCIPESRLEFLVMLKAVIDLMIALECEASDQDETKLN